MNDKRAPIRNKQQGKKAMFDTHRPLSPKISCKPSCTRSAKPGYFYNKRIKDTSITRRPPSERKEIETYVVQRTVRADRASRVKVTHLAHDRSDPTRAEPRSATTDQLSERAEELAFGERRLEREKVGEDADDHQQLFRRVALHEREERGVERVWYFDLVRVLP